MAAKAIMIQGTTSDAGKSFVATGLCRVLAQDGYKVAPFKSQNMSSYGFLTKEGKEMSRAQAIQAEAAMTEPSELMNPILIKPVSGRTSQIILKGENQGILSPAEYGEKKADMGKTAVGAFRQLARQYQRIVMEGAGSPAEIHHTEEDIVNMGMAKMADAPVLLVADINRGGAFASLYGTIKLLPVEQQKRIKGIIINKAQGDKAWLEAGINKIKDLTGIPVVGVLPMVKIDIESEDTLSGNNKSIESKDSLSGNNRNIESEDTLSENQNELPSQLAEAENQAYRDAQYNLLADFIRNNLDMKYIYSLFNQEDYDDIPEECKICTVLGCGGKSEDNGMGCVHVYYGTGKGKTAQSMGIALRAASNGNKVLMHQFIVKRDKKEQDFLNQIPGVTFVKAEPMKGFAFMMDEEEQAKNRTNFDQKLDELFELAKSYDVLILDEILYAVETNLLSEEKLLTRIVKRPCHLEVVLTGKVVSEKVLAMADFVTHVEKEKDSSMELGISGRLGIER